MTDTTEAGAGLSKENTDRLLWVDPVPDGQEWYAPSIHVTAEGGIGIDIGGNVVVLPLREWHRLGLAAGLRASSIRHSAGEVEVKPLEWSQSLVFGATKRRGFSPFGEWTDFVVDGLSEDEIRAEEAAAQADYEARIHSALSTPTPVAPTESAGAMETARCEVCGWPLASTANDGCVPSNCSMRPAPERHPPASGADETVVTEAEFERLRDAFVRGVEWNEENPLDREYSFKAGCDYADKTIAALGTKTAEPAVPVSEGAVDQNALEAAREAAVALNLRMPFADVIVEAYVATAQARAPTRRETGWLIERSYPDGAAPSWYVEDEAGWHDWTPVAADAKRFPAKAEAEALAAYRMIADDPDISFTEHVFGLAAQARAPDQGAVAPYGWEHGRSNGDDTYSVVFTKGANKPSNCHPDWPTLPLYLHPASSERERGLEEALREVRGHLKTEVADDGRVLSIAYDSEALRKIVAVLDRALSTTGGQK